MSHFQQAPPLPILLLLVLPTVLLPTALLPTALLLVLPQQSGRTLRLGSRTAQLCGWVSATRAREGKQQELQLRQQQRQERQLPPLK